MKQVFLYLFLMFSPIQLFAAAFPSSSTDQSQTWHSRESNYKILQILQSKDIEYACKSSTRFAKILNSSEHFPELSTLIGNPTNIDGLFIKIIKVPSVEDLLKTYIDQKMYEKRSSETKKAIAQKERDNKIKAVENEHEMHSLIQRADTDKEFIVPLYHVIKNPLPDGAIDYIFIMECAAYGDLLAHMQKEHLTQAEWKEIAKQILHIIKFLHSRNFYHRDIKPENILIVSKNPLHLKICDFGFSMVVDQSIGSDELFPCKDCGTAAYASPDIYVTIRNNNLQLSSNQLRSADLWAIGVTLFALTTRVFPFFVFRSPNTYKISINGLFESFLADPKSEKIMNYIRGIIDNTSITYYTDKQKLKTVLEIAFSAIHDPTITAESLLNSISFQEDGSFPLDPPPLLDQPALESLSPPSEQFQALSPPSREEIETY